MQLNQDFKDMLSALNLANVDFLVVGAHALAVHGYVRATGDLDLWIRPDSFTAPIVYRVLAEYGAPIHDLTVEDLASPDMVFQIGVAPCRIDILTAISGVEFDAAWQDASEVTIDGQEIFVIGRDHLILNKLATGRPKDIADVAALKSIEALPETD